MTFGRLLFLILFVVLLSGCSSKPKVSLARHDSSEKIIFPVVTETSSKREAINEQVRNLVENLINQPVMTPRSGFSGYLAHFNVIRTTTKDDPFSVIVEGEGYTPDSTPYEYKALDELKGQHPLGGTYAFSSLSSNGEGKDRFDPEARLVMEIPGTRGDGLMAIGYADGTVQTIKAVPGPFDDDRIQSILSERKDSSALE
jgi:hypothetical protein